MNIDIVLEAIEFASVAHSGTFRGRSQVPYLNHPISVARRIHRHGFTDPSILAVAILHDVPEDTKYGLASIHQKFGGWIARHVEDLTLPSNIGKDWQRKQEFQVQKMGSMGSETQGVKIADKTDNVFDLLNDPPNWSTRAIAGYATSSRTVVRAATSQDPRVLMMKAEFEDVYRQVAEHYKF